jgi:hypothetical protein
VREAAPDGGRFGPHAWDRVVGEIVPLKIYGETAGHVRLVAAEVVDDGTFALLTFEQVNSE